ncbi:MAG: hypothetical protein GF344_05010 [Chitinivibrionales bacterium]|nr:hypothetical protein [Chitinivibrionales bacterium]MBD3356360.1 hypothetical protein [Chitinivibrionales bacterium]
MAEGTQDSSTIALDLGNTLYPGYLSRFSYGSLIAEILNQVRLTGRRVTVRDFFQGSDRLTTLANRAAYPSVCTNMFDKNTGEAVFLRSAHIRAVGVTVRLVAVISPKRNNKAPRKGIHIEDPVESLRAYFSSAGESEADLTICLCDRNTLDRYPDLTAIPGVDIFACGVDALSSSGRLATRMIELENGARIVHVPPFQAGIGRIELDSCNSRPTVRYTVDTTLITDGVSLNRLERLHRKWSALYRRESTDTVARYDSSLSRDQTIVVGNLLREKTRAEAAAFEQALVAPVTIPPTITVQTLDRLLNASPDLYMMPLRGSDIRRARNIEGLTWVGVEDGKIEGRDISSKRRYRVVVTEEAKDAILEVVRGRLPMQRFRPLFVSLNEVVRDQLSTRKRTDYSFEHLQQRPRLGLGLELESSRKRVRVRNPDSLSSLPGATYESFSAWDVDLALPLSLHNRRHELEFKPRLQYAAANEKVGRNDLEFKLDYAFGPMSLLKPYASARYETYVALRPDESRSVKVRATLGAQATLSDWRWRLGLGTEKGIMADNPNPFAPFFDVFRDTAETWGPGIEFSVDGTYSLSDALCKRGVDFFKYRSLALEADLESYFGTSRKTTRFQTEFDLDLVIQLIPPLKFRAGYRLYYAHLFNGRYNFSNLEPSLAILGAYDLTW